MFILYINLKFYKKSNDVLVEYTESSSPADLFCFMKVYSFIVFGCKLFRSYIWNLTTFIRFQNIYKRVFENLFKFNSKVEWMKINFKICLRPNLKPAQAQSQQQILKINMPYPPIRITPTIHFTYFALYSLFSLYFVHFIQNVQCHNSFHVLYFSYPEGIYFLVCKVVPLSSRYNRQIWFFFLEAKIQ